LSVVLFLGLASVITLGVMNFGVNKSFGKQGELHQKTSAEDFIAQKLTAETTLDKFLSASLNRTTKSITYDPAYYAIDFPMGDVPADKGVCTDVIIRAYREIGIDLQELVHKDMGESFHSYPKNWNLKRRDTNIDHRRVPNLQNFFARNGKSLTISDQASDYTPGDLVTWKLSHGAPHIGIVVPSPYENDNTPWIIHNVGSGPRWDNCLFDYKITGHYRYKLD